MFTEGFGRFAATDDRIECEADGFTCIARLEHDQDAGAPWENAEGHGSVSEWTTRDKLPGERVLSEDRRSKRFYDFAEAIKTAKRDGWGCKGGRLEGETVGQYAARAVEEDFKFLQSWCRDDWHYVGVIVEVSREEVELGQASLWCVECNVPGTDNGYLLEVANELLDEAMTEAKATLVKLAKVTP